MKTAAAGILLLLFFVYSAEIYPKNSMFGRDETAFWLSLKNVEKEDGIARLNVGFFLLQKDESKALSHLNAVLALKDHPLHDMFKTRAYEELAAFYTRKKDFRKADFYFQELLKGGPLQSLHFSFVYADFLALTGRAADAEKIVRNLVDTFPQNHLVLLHAAQFYMAADDPERGVDLLEKDYILFPNQRTLELLRRLKSKLPSSKSSSTEPRSGGGQGMPSNSEARVDARPDVL
jgi:tetratricopeptide (TPR) repeat protein